MLPCLRKSLLPVRGAPNRASLPQSLSTVQTIRPLRPPFQFAFWLGAIIVMAGGIVVLFGEEVLDPRRHKKFAHLPTLKDRRNGNGQSSTEHTSTPILAHQNTNMGPYKIPLNTTVSVGEKHGN